MSLVEATLALEQETRNELWAKYRELLDRNDPKEARALRKVAEQLGISLDRLAKDLAVIRQAAALEAQAAPADDPQVAAEIEAAHDEYVRYRDENEQVFRDRKAEEQRLYLAWMTASGKKGVAREARGRLTLLLKKHWELFGREESEATPEPQPRCDYYLSQSDPDDVKEKGIARVNRLNAFRNTGTTVREKATGMIRTVSGSIDWDRYERLDSNEELKVLRQIERGEQPHLDR